MNQEQLFIEFSVQHCSAELSINDIPLFHFTENPVRNRVAGPLDPYLLHGRNHLSITLAPGATPTTAAQPGSVLRADAEASARIFRRRLDGKEDGGATPLVEFIWPIPGQPALPQPGPVTALNTSFVIDHPVPAGDWYWRRASTPSAEQVRAVLHRLHADLSAGDTAYLLALHRPKILNFCTALGMDPTTQLNNLRATIDPIVKAPDFTLAPMTAVPAVELRPIAGRRMLDVLCQDWQSPIRAGEPGTATWFAVRLRLGVLDGNPWILC